MAHVSVWEVGRIWIARLLLNASFAHDERKDEAHHHSKTNPLLDYTFAFRLAGSKQDCTLNHILTSECIALEQQKQSLFHSRSDMISACALPVDHPVAIVHVQVH